jgi:hypothetical protein
MSDKQSEEKIAPTSFQIFGISVLVGTIVGLIAAYYDPLGTRYGHPGIFIEEYDYVVRSIAAAILFIFIGAGIGVFSQKTGQAKWRGLWVLIILFSLLCICGPGALYIIVGGQ